MAQAADDHHRRELSLAELVAVLYRRRWLLLGALLLGGGAGTGLALAVPPVFTAQTLILLAPQAGVTGPAAAGAGISGGTALDGGVVDSQTQILASRSLAREAIARLGLDGDAELGTADPSGPLAVFSARATTVAREAGTAATPPADVVGRFLERLTVRREGKSYAIAVAYRSSDPAKAARVANTLADLYLAAQTERKQAAARRAGGWLAEQRDLVRGQLERAQGELAAFRGRDGREPGGGALAVERDEIADLNRQLVLAAAERSAREARVGQLRSAAGGASSEATAADAGSPLLQNLSALKAELLRREAELAGQYGERHPRLVDVRGEQAELDARIAQERRGLLRGMEGELDAARAKERALARALDELKGRAVRQDDSSREAAALEREVEVNRRLYESLLERASAAAGSGGALEPDARVISEAVPPGAPTSPKPRLVSSLGAALGLSLGLLLVYLLESRDRGFRSAREIQAELGLPTVALIPELRAAGRRRGSGAEAAATPPAAYALERPRSRYAEALREVLASLLTEPLAGPAGGPAKVVLLTSVVPDEGKSTLTLSLGRLAVAEGLRVLAVDADLRRPSLHELAGLKPGPGIAELLKGEAPLEEVMRADPRSDLKILAGSGRLSQPARLFTPDKVGRLLAGVRGTFDLVLVDAAPLAAVADPRLLAPLVDRTLLVVRYGSTRRELCAHCLGALRATGASLGGVVLSRVDLRRHRESGAADAGFAYARLAHYYAD